MEPSAGLESTKLVERKFTTPGVDPFDHVEWSRRDVWVGTKYEHLGVEAPTSWSDNAVAITSKLYLAKAECYREDSVKDLIRRIARKITTEGIKAGYFGEAPTFEESGEREWNRDACVFYDELCHILVNQIAVFNSPVLFNVGRPDRGLAWVGCPTRLLILILHSYFAW